MRKFIFRAAAASTALAALTGIASYCLMGCKAEIGGAETTPERFDALMRAYRWGINLQPAVVVLLCVAALLWIAALAARFKK